MAMQLAAGRERSAAILLESPSAATQYRPIGCTPLQYHLRPNNTFPYYKCTHKLRFILIKYAE